MPPNQQNQYDFITNSPKQRRTLNIGKTPGQRIAIVVGVIILIIIVAVAFSSFLGRDAKAHSKKLTEVAKSQTEIIRVSSVAAKEAKSPKAQNHALNTKHSVQSSHQEVKSLLEKRGVKGKGLNKRLAASKNTKNDDTLKEGGLNNRYDETFIALTNKQLADYQKVIKAAFPSSSPNEKKTLTAAFENAGRLSVKEASKQ